MITFHRRWLGTFWLSVAVAIPPAAAAGDDAQAPPAARLVVYSASGGISKGSYQGGVDWTVTEFLRRQWTADFRSKLDLRERFELGSFTGASAGNINAVFAALAWCTESADGSGAGVMPIPAEQSLFWTAWTETGVGDLLPLDRKHLSEAAVFSRELFETRHKASLAAYLAAARPRPSCHVPVGLTLTRLSPIEVAIAGGQGSAKVQRFSSVFEVVARSRLDFAFPDPVRIASKESLGAMALLPSLRETDPLTAPDRLRDVFDVILGSSAFPVAFASREICYEPGGLRPLGTADTQRRPCPRFTDGGVFDNNPLGLAVRLAELQRAAGGRLDRVEVAYTSPDTYRGELRTTRNRRRDTADREGLGAVLQLAGGAVGSARQYELQALARQVARDGEMQTTSGPEGAGGATVLRQSSRGTPIVGETVNSFGAFLGRPFREYDFYAGIYDGLEFVARHFLCGGRDDVEDCTAREHARLVDENIFDLSPMAQRVTVWLRDLEYRPGRRALPAVSGDDVLRELVLRRIHDQFAPRRADAASLAISHPGLQVTTRCDRVKDVIRGVLCPGGLDDALQALAADDDVYRAAAALLERCSASACHMDRPFVDLLEGPRRYVYRLAKKAIENMEHGEEGLRALDPPPHEYSAWVEAAFSFFRASTMRYRDGIKRLRVELNMSTGRWDSEHLLASAANTVLPNYVTWAPGKKGEDPVTLGWRPLTVPLTDAVYIGSSMELSVRQPPISEFTWTGRREHLAWGASVGTFAWHPARTTSVEIGAYKMSRRMADAVGSEGRWSIRTSGRWLGDKVLGAVAVNRSSFTVQLGLSDLNGIVYWIVR